MRRLGGRTLTASASKETLLAVAKVAAERIEEPSRTQNEQELTRSIVTGAETGARSVAGEQVGMCR